MKKSSFKYLDYEVIDKEVLAPEIVLLKIKGRLNFDPGQFIQVSLPNYGEGTYAPCSNPQNKEFFDICVRGCGNLSNQLIRLLPGDKLSIRGPYGKGWPIGSLLENDIIMITGGIGIIPLRPLIYQIINNRKDFKNLKLISGYRTEEFVLFKEEITLWKRQFNNVDIVLEHGFNDSCHNGLITDRLKNIKIPSKAKILICGPEPMIQPCNDILLKSVIDSDIYISLERRMECGIGMCQHCSVGKYLVCEDGPVFRYDKIKNELDK